MNRSISIKITNFLSITLFFLLYYVYLNDLRKVFIPFENVVIPLILILIVIASVINSKMKIKFCGNDDKVLCFSWLFIAIYIFLNNYDLTYNFIRGGMIQLYAMIVFMIFSCDSEKWFKRAISVIIFFAVLSAFATITFYFSESLYRKYLLIMFNHDEVLECLKYYGWGYMCGLYKHFSSNGMALGMGLMLCYEKLISLNKQKKVKGFRKLLYYVSMFAIFYALILSSKRAPFIAAIFAMIFTYVISKKKNVVKRILTICLVSIVGIALFGVMVNTIPGLSTITDKFVNSQNSSGGLLSGRTTLWSLAFDMIKEKPIVGQGYGSYYFISSDSKAISYSAHNNYLQIMAELGLVGLLLYLSAFISGLIATIKLLHSEKDENNIMELKIDLEIQLFVILYCLSSTALIYYSILIPLFLAYGSIHAKNIKRGESLKEGEKIENRNINIYKYN